MLTQPSSLLSDIARHGAVDAFKMHETEIINSTVSLQCIEIENLFEVLTTLEKFQSVDLRSAVFSYYLYEKAPYRLDPQLLADYKILQHHFPTQLKYHGSIHGETAFYDFVVKLCNGNQQRLNFFARHLPEDCWPKKMLDVNVQEFYH